MYKQVFPFLQLLRPANVVTALADVLGGFAISWFGFELVVDQPWPVSRLLLLLISTAGLYGGGVVLNDVYDARLDAVERPERPIPSGRVRMRDAAVFGAILLGAGIIAASVVSMISGGIALLISILTITYNSRAKHHGLIGPINMGACRALNLLLGMSIVPNVLMTGYVSLILIPWVYIIAITALSHGEVSGGRRRTSYLSVILVIGVALILTVLIVRAFFHTLETIPFLLLFVSLVLPPFLATIRNIEPLAIRKSVRAGIMGLVVMDAVFASGYGGWMMGLLVLALLPLSFGLARSFAVT